MDVGVAGASRSALPPATATSVAESGRDVDRECTLCPVWLLQNGNLAQTHTHTHE